MAERYIRRRIGDRRDGRRLRTILPSLQFSPFIMRTRSDAGDFFEDSVEVSGIDRWIRLKRVEGMKDVSIMHLFVAAYVRTIAHRPGLNRFVAGHHLFSRNDIDVVLTASRSAARDSGMTSIKVRFDPTDTIYDVYRKINDQIESIKADERANTLERLIASMIKMPRFLLKFLTGLFRLLDYFGWLGPNVLFISPYHGSVLISDVGSYGSPPIYHHLYNFGSIPVSISIGRRRAAREIDAAGGILDRKYVDYGVVLDGRIADSAFFASAFKYIKHYLSNPSLLENPPERVDEDSL